MENRDFTEKMRSAAKEYSAPFASAVLLGLAAHTFVFTNKLMNADEVDSLFGKGATVTSGRWGLELIKYIFPDQSMPWLYGVITLLLFALSACLIIRAFEIKGKLMRILLAGMITVFPSLTGTYCFMFTSSAYALAFLFTVVSVTVFGEKGGGSKWIACPLLLTAALGIYQSYIAAAAGLFVLYVFKKCIDGENSFKKLALNAVSYLAVLLLAVGAYFAVTLLVLKLTGSEFNFYVRQNVYTDADTVGIIGRIRMAYDFFTYYFTYREFALITGEASRYAHIVLMTVCAVGLAAEAAGLVREKKAAAAAGMLCAAVILPLAVDCLFLVFSKESVHTLALYSFVCVYVLAAMLTEKALSGGSRIKMLGRDAVYICLIIAIVSNVYFANKVYLKLYLQYENAYSFYSILLARVENTEGFDEGCSLAVIGDQDNKLRRFDELDVGYIQGPSYDLVNIYSREKFFNYYLGSSIPFAYNETKERIKTDERFIEMPEYPYYGSVRKIDDCIVVKLG